MICGNLSVFVSIMFRKLNEMSRCRCESFRIDALVGLTKCANALTNKEKLCYYRRFYGLGLSYE
jgi:hypothetical protein